MGHRLGCVGSVGRRRWLGNRLVFNLAQGEGHLSLDYYDSLLGEKGLAELSSQLKQWTGQGLPDDVLR